MPFAEARPIAMSELRSDSYSESEGSRSRFPSLLEAIETEAGNGILRMNSRACKAGASLNTELRVMFLPPFSNWEIIHTPVYENGRGAQKF
jgi:hypothetical protein